MKKLTAFATLALTFVTVSCGNSSASSNGSKSASKSEFCTAFSEANAAVDELTNQMDSSTTDEETAKSQKKMEDLVATLADTMTKSAPNEIRDEAKLVSSAMVTMIDLLASIDYDFTQVDSNKDVAAKLEEVSNTPGLEEANATLETYLKDKCGIDSTADSTPAGGESSLDDFCQNARKYLSASMSLGMIFDPDSPDKDSVLLAYGTVASLASAMTSAAPTELRGQAKIISDRATAMVTYLKSAGGDINAAIDDPDFQQLDGDSASTEAMQLIQSACGISLSDG